MTREEAIERIKDHKIIHKINEPRAIYISETLDMAIKALKQTNCSDFPNNCDDAISRQAAIVQLSHNKNGYDDCDVIIQKDIETIKALPSVKSTAKSGHWIDTGSGQMCSRCGEIQYGHDNFRCFCASCGAKMIEPQESEE